MYQLIIMYYRTIMKLLSIPSIIRLLTLIEHKEDVNDFTDDPSIVKTTSVVLKML